MRLFDISDVSEALFDNLSEDGVFCVTIAIVPGREYPSWNDSSVYRTSTPNKLYKDLKKICNSVSVKIVRDSNPPKH